MKHLLIILSIIVGYGANAQITCESLKTVGASFSLTACKNGKGKLFYTDTTITNKFKYKGFDLKLVNDLTDYEGIGPIGYFGIALRQSLGDYDTASFAKNSDYDILTWLVWLVVMLVGNVIFMNFIIAVVGQSYESCM